MLFWCRQRTNIIPRVVGGFDAKLGQAPHQNLISGPGYFGTGHVCGVH